MLKLTRHLYRWSADPRLFDYYERTLLNHRLPAIDRQTGATQYYLSVFPGAWKTFNKPNDSFWCCTGTGVEEFTKLNDSIYFHDGDQSLFVNLYIPSELHWAERQLVVRQETIFPQSDTIQLHIQQAPAESIAINLRIPFWVGGGASVQTNGQPIDVTPAARSYFSLVRKWKAGDRITLRLPMQLRTETMPDNSNIAAVFYGPLLLAGYSDGAKPTAAETVGPLGPALKSADFNLPTLKASDVKLVDASSMTFSAGDVKLTPFYRTFDTRYSVYWRLA